jgi:hypothetical protein
MLPFLRKKIPRWIWWILIYLLIAAVRIGWIWYDRSRPFVWRAPRQALTLKANPDSQATIPKFRIADLEEAQSLVGRTLWWKAGFQSPFFPLDASTGKLQTLNPQPIPTLTIFHIERVFELKGKGIYLAAQNQGKECATRIALFDPQDQVYQFFLDDLFFPDNPFCFYPHWSPPLRQIIQSHQVQPGMTFAQLALSLGAGELIKIEDKHNQVYRFPSLPGGKPGITEVHFTAGKLTSYKIL